MPWYPAGAKPFIQYGLQKFPVHEYYKHLQAKLTIGVIFFIFAQLFLYIAHSSPVVLYRLTIVADGSWWKGIKNEELFAIFTKALGISKGKPVAVVPATSLTFSGLRHLVSAAKQRSILCGPVAAWTLASSGLLGPCVALVLLVTYLAKPKLPHFVLASAVSACRFVFLSITFEAMLTSLLLVGNFRATHGEAFIALLVYWLLSCIGLRVLIGTSPSESSLACGLRHCGMEAFLVKLKTLRREILLMAPMLVLVLVLCSLHFSFVNITTTEVRAHMQDSAAGGFKPYHPLVKMLGMGQDQVNAMVRSFVHKMPIFHRSSSLMGMVGTLCADAHTTTAVGASCIFIASFVVPVICAFLSSILAWQHLPALAEKESPASEEAKETTPLVPGAIRNAVRRTLIAGGWLHRLRLVEPILQDFSVLDLFAAGACLALRCLPAIAHADVKVGGGFYALLAAAFLSTVHSELCSAISSNSQADAVSAGDACKDKAKPPQDAEETQPLARPWDAQTAAAAPAAV